MPKDYAKYVSKSKRPLAERGWRKRLLWVGLLCFLLAGMTYGVYIYEHHKIQQTLGPFVKQIQSWFIKTPNQQALLQIPDDSHEEETEIQFSFYTSLPSMQVPVQQEPSSHVVENKVKPSLEKPPLTASAAVIRHEEKYLLQVAAFKNPTAAGEMRISLLLAGFEVEIVKAMNNNQQIYQLQQGPFETIARAKAMQQQLKNKGIESVIVKKIM